MVFAGCTSEDISNTPTEDRLPLRLEATLSAGSPVTRATDNEFEATDTLLSFVRHVYNDGKSYNSDQASLVKFTTSTAGTALYWDDFSETTADSVRDLRTSGHGLQSYYGYCYNGTKIGENDLEISTGVLKWSTTADQSVDGAMKKNDLLWSKTQGLVKYDHAAAKRGTLIVPYTHAMSKFTIVVVAGDGFVASDLNAATVTLNGMNLTGEFNAPDSTLNSVTGTTTVKMFAKTASTTNGKPSRDFEAVVVPLTDLSSNNLLATISLGGNNYNVNMSDNIRSNWGAKLYDNNKTISGVNYKLTVTLKKQTVDVVATLANWKGVDATGTGEIQFNANVATIGTNDSNLKYGDSFALWMTKDLSKMGSVATTAEYDGSKFTNTHEIYWPNGNESFYFRALANKTSTHTLEAVDSTSVFQGTDLLWGTSGADAIKPRTGTVALNFNHAMSNVVVKLTTTTDSSKVDTTGVKITIDSLYTQGSIDISNGLISTKGNKGSVTVSGETIMVPQTITDKTRLIITLKDSTTYSLQLNKLNSITKWESGKQYNYTISVTKEAVKFLVQIKDWAKEDGSGNATLDWD